MTSLLLVILSAISAQAAEPFPELRAIADDPDRLLAFMDWDVEGVPQAAIDEAVARQQKMIGRWADDDPHRECRAGRCLVTTGPERRPVAYVNRLPKGQYTLYSHSTQLAKFKEHYTVHFEVEGKARLTVNGSEPFVYGTVQDDTAESRFFNDWLQVGENTLTVEPLGDPAQLRLAVGGHALFVPVPDESRANRIDFQGRLTEAKTFSLTAPPAPPPLEPVWPTDIEAHMEKGLATWLAGGDEYAWLPWQAWVKDDVRDQIRAMNAEKLELVMIDIDLAIDEAHYLGGQYVPHPDGPRWIYAELVSRPIRSGTTDLEGPRAVFGAHAVELLRELRAEGCPAAERQVSSKDWIRALGAEGMSTRLQTGRKKANEALRAACELARSKPDVPLAYDFDDVVFALHDPRGTIVGNVYAEVDPEEGDAVMFSLLKRPTPTR